ncbi:hypothetical protein M0Q50_10115 [bacterium]|jgi:hypothetical protein|nr:hypothetical protein [bacterium]
MEDNYFESIIDEGNINRKQDILIYGKEYHLWRNKKYLGKAIYTEDENIGDSFLKSKINDTGDFTYEVYRADEWIFV